MFKSVKYRSNRNARLGTRQTEAYADMRAPTKTNVAMSVRSVQDEFVRLIKVIWVATRRTPPKHHTRSLLKWVIANLSIFGNDPIQALNGAFETHDFV